MAVEFGIFDHIEAREGTSTKELYEDRIAFLKRAEEGGFYGFHLAEHHGHGFPPHPRRPFSWPRLRGKRRD